MILRIRKEQVELFEAAALRSFEEELVGHLKEFAPVHWGVVGEPAVRGVVRLGMERAARYGLTNRGPVRSYVELMFMLGSDFDTDPQLPWAEDALAVEPADQLSRAERLHEGVMGFFDTVIGPEYEYEKEALRRYTRLRLEDLPQPGEHFREEIVERLKELYPQKCEHMGEPRLRLLVRRGLEVANEYSVSCGAGDALVIVLMLAFGHGCTADRQFPWIQSTLSDAGRDPGARVKRLHAKLTTYTERGLAHFEGR